MKHFWALLFLAIICFPQFLFGQDSTSYYLTRNSWCMMTNDLFSDTMLFENLDDEAGNFPSKLDHYFYKFDSTKMKLQTWAALTFPDSVMVAGDYSWKLSADKKTLVIDWEDGEDVIYFIATLDEKKMLLIRKK